MIDDSNLYNRDKHKIKNIYTNVTLIQNHLIRDDFGIKSFKDNIYNITTMKRIAQRATILFTFTPNRTPKRKRTPNHNVSQTKSKPREKKTFHD